MERVSGTDGNEGGMNGGRGKWSIINFAAVNDIPVDKVLICL